MQITKAMLDNRQQAIETDIRSIEQTSIALKGALQDVLYWQARLAQEENTPVTPEDFPAEATGGGQDA